MPIYEYQCEQCGHQFDALQKISDAPLKECPECEQHTLRKLVSAPSFKLKGTGWYETDFKTKKPANDKAPADTKETVKESKTEDSKQGKSKVESKSTTEKKANDDKSS